MPKIERKFEEILLSFEYIKRKRKYLKGKNKLALATYPNNFIELK